MTQTIQTSTEGQKSPPHGTTGHGDNFKRRRARMTGLTVFRLKELLSYDKETGVFTWIKRTSPASRIVVGERAGWVDGDYIRIMIDEKSYRAHRLAWLYVNGRWPDDQLDHKNRNPKDNRIENLRQCCNSQNQANKEAPENNTSGYKGVSWNKGNGKWVSYIYFEGGRLHLGSYDYAKSAAIAYNDKAVELFGDFSCLNDVSLCG